jgi:hypothetical protein
MATIGSGYYWPNITIFSDGERTALVAKPSYDTRPNALRYIANGAAVVPSTQLENAFDEFIEQIIGQLKTEKINNTNLQKIWGELLDERRSPEESKKRKLEALLGFDPDEADANLIHDLASDPRNFGAEAVGEIAASPRRNEALSTRDIVSMAQHSGFDTSPRDSASITHAGISRRQDVAAWKRGAETARALRNQMGLKDRPISNKQLAGMAGTSIKVLESKSSAGRVSFAWDETPQSGKIALRSKWDAGRRFELARIIGDRIMNNRVGHLFPATESYTYRQKAQRSFAAELLSPFEIIDERLSGDFSAEAQRDIASEFKVSELTVRTLLMNHHRIERDDWMESRLGEDF